MPDEKFITQDQTIAQGFTEQIKECDRDIKNHLLLVDNYRSMKAKLFRYLSSVCEHRSVDKEHCRHEELKRTADAAGCNMYANGCCVPVCPLLKQYPPK